MEVDRECNVMAECLLRDQVQSKRSTPSYIEYMTAAFGTTRIRWALSPL